MFARAATFGNISDILAQLVDSVAVAVTNVGYGTHEFRANLVYSVLQFIGFVLIRNFHRPGYLFLKRTKLVAQGRKLRFVVSIVLTSCGRPIGVLRIWPR